MGVWSIWIRTNLWKLWVLRVPEMKGSDQWFGSWDFTGLTGYLICLMFPLPNQLLLFLSGSHFFAKIAVCNRGLCTFVNPFLFFNCFLWLRFSMFWCFFEVNELLIVDGCCWLGAWWFLAFPLGKSPMRDHLVYLQNSITRWAPVDRMACKLKAFTPFYCRPLDRMAYKLKAFTPFLSPLINLGVFQA